MPLIPPGKPMGVAQFCYAGDDPELKGAKWQIWRQWPYCKGKLEANGEYPKSSEGGCMAEAVLRYRDEKPNTGFSARRAPVHCVLQGAGGRHRRAPGYAARRAHV